MAMVVTTATAHSDASSYYEDDEVPVASSSHEEEEVPIVLIPNIPIIKFHNKPFYFMSEPGITQQEYQQRVIANG